MYTEVNIALNDEATELLEIEGNLCGGMNFRHCYEVNGVPKEYEFSVMDIPSLKNIIEAIQEHIDNQE